MIIVSQDKNMIINFNNIVATYVTKKYVPEEEEYKGYNIDFATREEINFVLATYETEERAKEVLQEIAKRNKEFEILENCGYYELFGGMQGYAEMGLYEMPER